MVVHHLLAYHDVRPSETVKGRLAYYQDDAKRAAGIRTPIKVRKYLSKFFGEFRSPATLERTARFLDEFMQSTDDYDVRIYTDADIDGWADAYYHVPSCMSTQTNAYGVGERETYRCYCTAAMTDGKKSSGLSLAVLYQDGKPVARAITYEQYGDRYYVRNYGDDRLVKWLDEHGYEHCQRLPRDTHLWTECYDEGKDEYLSPYVDGKGYEAQANLTIIDGQPYWVISSEGVVLQNCCGYTNATPLTCDCCGDNIADDSEHIRPDLHDDEVTLCSCCEESHCHTVDNCEGVYVSEDDLSDLIATNDQGYYTQEYLDNHDLVLTGDNDVIYLGDAEYCEYQDEYYSRYDFTDLSDEPEFVRETWAGYINDRNLVRTCLLRRHGMFVTELQCYIHDDHVDSVYAKLAGGEQA